MIRLGLNLRRNFVGILVPVLIGLVGFVLLPVLPGVPVLPLMVTGFLIANRGEFALSGEEKRNIVIAGVFLIALLAVIWLVTRALEPETSDEDEATRVSALSSAHIANTYR